MVLDHIKVVDLTRVRAGPTCVRLLSDWGADVIQVSQPAAPGEPDALNARHGPDYLNLHRNKRNLVLDLKQEDGRAVLRRLVERADIVVENYRPDVKFRLGIDYETLAAENPRLIYASISGYGQDGPYRDRPGVDQIAQGMGGLMSITGEPGGRPTRAGIAVADLTAGMFCAHGILLALIERERSGQGQWVQSSLLAAQIAMLDFQAARFLIKGEVPGPEGNNHPTSIPTRDFRTSDGYINLAASGDLFPRLCGALGTEDWLSDPDFATARARTANRDALNDRIEDVTATRTTAEWVERLNAAGVPCGPIYTIDEVFADPQVRHLAMAQPVDHRTVGRHDVVAMPMTLSRTPSSVRSGAPELGQHSEAILAELGYDAAAVAALRDGGVI